VCVRCTTVLVKFSAYRTAGDGHEFWCGSIEGHNVDVGETKNWSGMLSLPRSPHFNRWLKSDDLHPSSRRVHQWSIYQRVSPHRGQIKIIDGLHRPDHRYTPERRSTVKPALIRSDTPYMINDQLTVCRSIGYTQCIRPSIILRISASSIREPYAATSKVKKIGMERKEVAIFRPRACMCKFLIDL